MYFLVKYSLVPTSLGKKQIRRYCQIRDNFNCDDEDDDRQQNFKLFAFQFPAEKGSCLGADR